VILGRKFDSQETRIQAEAKFKRKEAQALEGAKAMAEYEAARRAVIEKTARLKALRLAKEAAEARGETPPVISPKKKRFSSPA
jgi:multidrug efflux pump subunit AcrA (membrane-fusion protein)